MSELQDDSSVTAANALKSQLDAGRAQVQQLKDAGQYQQAEDIRKSMMPVFREFSALQERMRQQQLVVQPQQTPSGQVRSLMGEQKQLMGQLEQFKTQHDQLLEQDPYGAAKIKQDAQRLFPALESNNQNLAVARNQLEKSLQNGDYLVPDPNDPLAEVDFSMQGITKKTSEVLSLVSGEEVDLSDGAENVNRAWLAFHTPENQILKLQESFGEENVKVQNVGGDRFILVREGGKWKPVNPMGPDAGDVSTISADVFPFVSELVGGALGLVATKTPLGMAAGAAMFHTAAGTAQDKFAAAVDNLHVKLSDAFLKRTTEAAVGMGIDYATAKLGTPFLAKRAARKITPETYRERMSKLAEDMDLPLDIRALSAGGDEKVARRVLAFQRRPMSKGGQAYNHTLANMETIKSDLSPAEKGAKMYDNTMANIVRSIDDTAAILRASKKEIGDTYEKVAERKLSELVPDPDKAVREDIGETFHRVMQGVEADEKKIKNKFFDGFHAKNDASQVFADPEDFAMYLRKQHGEGTIRNPEVFKIIESIEARPALSQELAQIKKELSTTTDPLERKVLQRRAADIGDAHGPISTRQLDEYRRQLASAAPETTAGASAKEGKAISMAKAARNYEENFYAKNNLTSEWKDAVSKYDSYMSLHQQQLGGILKSTFGRSDLTGSQITDRIVSNPRLARDLFSKIRTHAPDQYESVLKSAQDAWYRRRGYTSGTGVNPKQNFDPDEVMAIFGYNDAGAPSKFVGERNIKRLRSLNRDLEQIKGAKPGKITLDELDEMGAAMHQNEFDAVKDKIIKRLKAEADVEKLKNNAVIRAAKNGHREAWQSHDFPEALWSAPTDDVDQVLKMVTNPKERELLRGDYYSSFLGNYPPNGQYGEFGEMLWDGDAFLSDIAKRPRVEANMRRVLGDKDVDRIIRDSEMMGFLKRQRMEAAQDPGGRINTQGAEAYAPAAGIISKQIDRFHTAMYRMKTMPVLRNFFRGKDFDAASYAKAYRKAMLKTITTERGLEMLSESGRFDPQFTAWLGENLGAMNSEEIKNRAEMGSQRSRLWDELMLGKGRQIKQGTTKAAKDIKELIEQY